jgi:hypothetical protein
VGILIRAHARTWGHTLEGFFSLVLLGGFIWAIAFLLPKARRERDTFGIVCSILAALHALGSVAAARDRRAIWLTPDTARPQARRVRV